MPITIQHGLSNQIQPFLEFLERSSSRRQQLETRVGIVESQQRAQRNQRISDALGNAFGLIGKSIGAKRDRAFKAEQKLLEKQFQEVADLREFGMEETARLRRLAATDEEFDRNFNIGIPREAQTEIDRLTSQRSEIMASDEFNAREKLQAFAEIDRRLAALNIPQPIRRAKPRKTMQEMFDEETVTIKDDRGRDMIYTRDKNGKWSFTNKPSGSSKDKGGDTIEDFADLVTDTGRTTSENASAILSEITRKQEEERAKKDAIALAKKMATERKQRQQEEQQVQTRAVETLRDIVSRTGGDSSAMSEQERQAFNLAAQVVFQTAQPMRRAQRIEQTVPPTAEEPPAPATAQQPTTPVQPTEVTPDNVIQVLQQNGLTTKEDIIRLRQTNPALAAKIEEAIRKKKAQGK